MVLRERGYMIIPPGDLRSLVVSGVIDGMGGVLGFVPLIMFMFFSIAILEDSAVHRQYIRRSPYQDEAELVATRQGQYVRSSESKRNRTRRR